MVKYGSDWKPAQDLYWDQDQHSEETRPQGEEGGSKESFSPEVALLHLMSKTGYNIVQENGQRKYGGPPPGWVGPVPPRGCEVFVGKIPRDMYEDKLVPMFERAGPIYEFRLMMEFSGENRGYAFVMYTNREAAQRAIQMLNNYEIRPGKHIGVCVSVDNCRLFIGSIPRDKKKDDIMEEMKKVTDGVVGVIVYSSSADKTKNRGFAFVEYESHKAAAMARRKLIPGTFQLWGHSIQVDWAEPEKDVDDEVMQRVRVLYVRNLLMNTTEETLGRKFSHFKPGCVERVKKLTDYAFIHFYSRDDALTALGLMNGAVIDGAVVEVTLAKPASVKEAPMGHGVGGRRYNSKGYLGNSNHSNNDSLMATEFGGGAAAGGGAGFMGHWNKSENEQMSALSTRLETPYYSTTDNGECTFPVLPGTPVNPDSVLSMKQTQICSAVTLLECFCRKVNWSLPEYHFHSSPGPDGNLLALYKVVIWSIRKTYVPDRLCLLVEEAKELAAQTTLKNLELLVSGGAYCDSSSVSPLPVSSPALPYGGQPFSSGLSPPRPSPFSSGLSPSRPSPFSSSLSPPLPSRDPSCLSPSLPSRYPPGLSPPLSSSFPSCVSPPSTPTPFDLSSLSLPEIQSEDFYFSSVSPESESQDDFFSPISPESESQDDFFSPISPESESQDDFFSPISPESESQDDFFSPISPESESQDDFFSPIAPESESQEFYISPLSPSYQP